MTKNGITIEAREGHDVVYLATQGTQAINVKSGNRDVVAELAKQFPAGSHSRRKNFVAALRERSLLN